jgi:hypothetical protein
MLRPYQKDKEGSEIVNRWHAANKKSDESVKKAKSKDNPENSSASRRSGFSTPCTNMEHKMLIGVDDIQDLDDAAIKFVYGKDLLPDWALRDGPPFMRRLHNWYKRACILGLKTIYAPYHLDVFGPKGPGMFDIMFDFADIQHMFRLKELGIEMVRLWSM